MRKISIPDMPITVSQDSDGEIKATIDRGALSALNRFLESRVSQEDVVERVIERGRLRHVKLENRSVDSVETKIGHGLGKIPHWYSVHVKSTYQRVVLTVLTSEVIGTTQTTVAHGLGTTPIAYWVLLHANTNVWETLPPDATNVYLRAGSSVSTDIILYTQAETPSSIKETRRADSDALYLSSSNDGTIVDILVEG